MFLIESDNLIIRPLTENDAEDIFEIKSDPEVMKYMDNPLHTTIEDSIKYIAQRGDDFIRVGVYHKASQKIVGRIDMFSIYKKHAYAYIGYELNRNFWKKGIMSEAISLFLHYCFRELKLHRIKAQIHEDNLTSQKLLEKLNFKKEAVLRENFLINGKFYNSYLYSILSTECLAQSI